MKPYWINEKILECKCTSSVPLIFFFALSRNFSLEEGKSAEKMEETNQPSDVRGMEDWCRSVDRKSSIRWTHNELTCSYNWAVPRAFAMLISATVGCGMLPN